jgi:type VI secretion system protein ImpK
MATVQIDENYLTGQFQEFYREVIRQKKIIQSCGDSLLATSGGEAADKAPQSAKEIHSVLLGILEKQAVDAGRRGGEYGIRYFREAQYVMAGLGDELFLHMEWVGRESWKANLLEFTLFGTHVAGELFFKRLDQLLKNRDAAQTGMAAVYHLALSLGFKGKYRGKDDAGKLDFLRRQLFSFIFHQNPDLYRDNRRLFPKAYAHTMDHDSGRRFPHTRYWILLIVAVVVLFLVTSYGLWSHLTLEMIELVDNFIK